MDKVQKSIENLEQDIIEIDKLQKLALRPNIKRQLEEYKNTLHDQIQEERKRLQIEKKRAEEKSENSNKQESSSIVYQTINKYAIDNTTDLFK